MTIKSLTWNQRSNMKMESKRRQWTWRIMITAVLFFFVAGCQNLKQLEDYKTRSSAGEYQWLAAQTIDCDSAGDTCGQLHLIKGDACFRLAKAKTDPKKHYACAALELEKGIMLIKKWEGGNGQFQAHENLCESLRNLQDLQSGQNAEATLEKLDAASKRMAALFPGTYAAVYFSAKTQLRKAQNVLWNIQDKPLKREKVCQALIGSLDAVKNATLKGRADGGEDWERYKNSYAWLTADLAKAIKLTGCR